MKIFLIVPPQASDIKKVLGVTGIPLGLAHLAATLPEYDVRIIDCLTENFGMAELEREIRLHNPDVVGLTATTPAIYNAYEAAVMVKRINPDCRVVIGGPHVTFTARETLRECEAIDVVVRGESELTFHKLVRAWDKGLPINRIAGLTFRSNGAVTQTPDRPFIQNLDTLPFPAWEKLPMEKYKFNGKRFGIVMTSRGCPFDCIFCSSSQLCGKIWRARNPENVVDELKLLHDEVGIREIEFMDDTFTLDSSRAEKVCDRIVKEGLDISWTCSSRVNTINKRLAEKLNRAGCHTVYFGIESGSQEILDRIGKGINLNQSRKAVKIARHAGLNSLGSFIIGLPGETGRSIRNTIGFAKRLGLTFAQFTTATPYPGTKLYSWAKRKGLLQTARWSDFTTLNPVMSIPGLNLNQLKRALIRAYLNFYLRPRFIFDRVRARNFLIIKTMFGTAIKYMGRW
jgi:radical SAM superfamily enzyme YgiQ (UPF0313 family)